MRRPWMTLGCAALVMGAWSLASCGGSNETDLSAPNAGGAIDAGTGGADASAGTGGAPDGGSGGEGGTAGTTSTGGAGGTGGSDGGAGGVAGTAGQAGAGGEGGTATGGSAGTGGAAGDGGASGSGGSGGTAGSGGSAGFGGASGSGGSGGDGGAGGSSGSAGAGGAGGTAGAGGIGGSGGTGGTSGAGGSGGSTDGGPSVCLSTKDCLATQYCAKQGCNAISGSCVDRPTMCNNNESPVCGCDGINYWNDCVRQLDGLEASTAGRCNSPTAKHCGGIGQLGCGVAWATCAYLYSNKSSCGIMYPMGVCWALPDACPSIVIGGNQRSCSDVNGACLDRCKAISSGGMYYDDNTCPQ